MRHLPGEELSGQRGRLEARRKRLDEQYEWGLIDAAAYRSKRSETDRELSELPPPADSNVLALTMLPPTSCRSATRSERRRRPISATSSGRSWSEW